MFDLNELLRLAGLPDQVNEAESVCDDAECTDTDCPVHGKDKMEESESCTDEECDDDACPVHGKDTVEEEVDLDDEDELEEDASMGGISAGGIATVSKAFEESDEDEEDSDEHDYDWMWNRNHASKSALRPGSQFDESEEGDLEEAKNEMGERMFSTYKAWVRACKALKPDVKFEGDADICQAFGVGEWDGATGVIFSDAPFDCDPYAPKHGVEEDSAFDELGGTFGNDYQTDDTTGGVELDPATAGPASAEQDDEGSMIEDILQHSTNFHDRAKLETLPYEILKRIHDKVMGQMFESDLSRLKELAGMSSKVEEEQPQHPQDAEWDYTPKVGDADSEEDSDVDFELDDMNADNEIPVKVDADSASRGQKIDDVAELIADILMFSDKYHDEAQLAAMPERHIRAIHAKLMDDPVEEDMSNGYDSQKEIDKDAYFPNGADGNVTGSVGPGGADQGDNDMEKAMSTESIHDIRNALHEALDSFMKRGK